MYVNLGLFHTSSEKIHVYNFILLFLLLIKFSYQFTFLSHRRNITTHNYDTIHTHIYTREKERDKEELENSVLNSYKDWNLSV